MTNWRLKIFAYLHDPPDKPLALGRPGGHETWGFELAHRLAGDPPDGEWGRWQTIIKRADWLASGADRSRLLPRRPPSLDELRHPLSGQRIDLDRVRPRDANLAERARLALDEEIGGLESLREVPDAAFVALWGLLPARLRERWGPDELRGLWDFLPAETRMPNHPVTAHAALVSALATILAGDDEAVLLSFSIGPVQRFIAQARRTSDLWAGSALLSRLLLAGALPIVETLGPDHVVFPVLRRTRLFLDWLLGDDESLGPSPWASHLVGLPPRSGPRRDSDTGALPNRFLAIVPAARATELARLCEQRARGFWLDLVGHTARQLEDRDPALAGFAAMAEAQARGFLRVAWAATPWPTVEAVTPGDAACQRAAWAMGGSLPEATAEFVGHPTGHGPGAQAFRPNGGALYGSCYESVERLLGMVKLTRPEHLRAEHGLKCSLCGQRGVVARPISFAEQRSLWTRLASRLPQGQLRRGEALCGVCWAKRCLGLERGRVPSTAEIAATPFKLRVLAELRQGRLDRETRAICEAVGRAGHFGGAWVLPILAREMQAGGFAGEFVRVRGEALLANPREDREVEDEEPPREILEKAAALRAAAARLGIVPPRPYLAAVMVDGDEMGRWLSGAMNLPLAKYLSEPASDDLKEAGAGEYLALTWPMTPALHAAVSEACAVFSQRTAPRTLHEDGLPAFLVYAGGDDVLALTALGCHDPSVRIETATDAALRLRLRFSGHVRRDDGRGDIPDPATEAGYVLDPREGLGLAFGRRATASAGLAVFHHRWPLARALEEARRAEEMAKKELGRDALCITIVRRSGQVTRTGLRFEVTEAGTAIRSFQRLCHAFAFGGLSPRLVTEIHRRLGALHGGLSGDELMNLASPLVRHAAGRHFEGKSDGLRDIHAALEDLGRAAAAQGPPRPAAGGEPPDAGQLRRWLDLIEAAAFLGRGEEP
jgi:CRISPR-associated protein Cmr2